MNAPFRVLVADDEPLARLGLRRLLEEIDGFDVVGESGTGEATLQAIERLDPDVVLLDIEMPGLDGLGVLQASDEARGPAIVLVTAFGDHGLAAFDAGAVDYVVKPVTRERLELALARAARNRASGAGAPAAPGRLVTKLGGRTRVIPLADVLWIEAAGSYVRLHLASEAVLHRESLSRLLERIESHGYVRIHRSAAVALTAIASLSPAGHGDATLTLRSGHSLTVSRRHRAALTNKLPNHQPPPPASSEPG